MATQSLGYTVFRDKRRIASGSLADAAIAYQQAMLADPHASVLIFDNLTGDTRDVDTRGSAADIRARYPDAATESPASASSASEPDDAPKGRGRPKLGVVAREVTLLPRHWDWLSEQRGGASVALRKLIDEARRANAEHDMQRRAQERSYSFMSTMAGDLAHFEEASRALFANDLDALAQRIVEWPEDVRTHLMRLTSTDDLVDALA
ncbi:DUF2239 family protein [Pandoraea sputorum]|uniref:Uncharacterized protein conserved in bacteria n=1 Tax=Pandoraea sputorum TaxID=93222 RepID=A0A239SJ56_9BURK|nr:DUF2239 family protein [Pandoraea sputorum]AJC17195.1 hypothetical protein NA29_16650 [Pandoraea sputorum]SNU85427.1 Uncharacterized protein conserved in bacteria [Pandoraea sputorum]VVD86226.1 hypothetical protein PSP20601_01379 [Pandoraea sputorum]VVE74804.1 hypothetical protein PSP31120_00312 [Pandoraea sputorum]